MHRQDLQKSAASLEEIYGQLRKINSLLWSQLRVGALSGCHALLYTVMLYELGEKLGWRDVNRRSVAALHRFNTAATEYERYASLQDGLRCVSQKVFIAKCAGLQKAETLERGEKEAIFAHEAELLRISRLLRSLSQWLHSWIAQEGSGVMVVHP
jgi:hypothetical protein